MVVLCLPKINDKNYLWLIWDSSFDKEHPWRQMNHSLQFSSVAQSCLTLCDPMYCSTPGFPVHQQLPELTETPVHQIGDAIQASRLLSSSSPPAFHLSHHQDLFQSVSSSHEVAKVLKLQLQHQYFQWTPRTDFLQDWLVRSPCSPRDSQGSSPTPQIKSINSLVLNFLYGPPLTSILDYCKNHSFLDNLCQQRSLCLCFLVCCQSLS